MGDVMTWTPSASAFVAAACRTAPGALAASDEASATPLEPAGRPPSIRRRNPARSISRPESPRSVTRSISSLISLKESIV